MAKRKTAKAKAKPKAKVKMRNVETRMSRSGKLVKAPKEDKPKPPKPSLYERIGPSPIKITKPDRLTHEVLVDLDVCHDGLVWMKEYAPRGFPMDVKKATDVMAKAGASITFDNAWCTWIINSFVARAMNTVETKDKNYKAVQLHCAVVLKSFLREFRARRVLGDKHLAAGIGSQRDTLTDLVSITIRHYDKL